MTFHTMPNLQADMSRRRFLGLMGAAGAATVAVSALGTRFALATPEDPRTGDVIVHIFLRGGVDALNVFAPANDSAYQTLRQSIRVAPSVGLQMIRGGNIVGPDLGGRLFMHPDMAALYNGAWKDGRVAVVHACGFPTEQTASRSHFDAEKFWANGSVLPLPSGFMNRFAGQVPTDRFNAVGFGSNMPQAFLGSGKAFAFLDEPSFAVTGFGDQGRAVTALQSMYPVASDPIRSVGGETLGVVGLIGALPADPGPQNGADYTKAGSLGEQLSETARLIRANVGMRSAGIVVGGWDTHAEDVASGGRLSELGNALQAFYQDLGPVAMKEVTVVVVSEFGRTIRQNSSGGTDHGRGGAVMVLGGNIKGGIYGGFPANIDEGRDADVNALPVVNDFRRVLSEVLSIRGGATNLASIFPDYQQVTPLGLAIA